MTAFDRCVFGLLFEQQELPCPAHGVLQQLCAQLAAASQWSLMMSGGHQAPFDGLCNV
jgi:hypothetical protein